MTACTEAQRRPPPRPPPPPAPRRSGRSRAAGSGRPVPARRGPTGRAAAPAPRPSTGVSAVTRFAACSAEIRSPGSPQSFSAYGAYICAVERRDRGPCAGSPRTTAAAARRRSGAVERLQRRSAPSSRRQRRAAARPGAAGSRPSEPATRSRPLRGRVCRSSPSSARRSASSAGGVAGCSRWLPWSTRTPATSNEPAMPPTRSARSSTVTGCPRRAACQAAASPAGPAPSTTIGAGVTGADVSRPPPRESVSRCPTRPCPSPGLAQAADRRRAAARLGGLPPLVVRVTVSQLGQQMTASRWRSRSTRSRGPASPSASSGSARSCRWWSSGSTAARSPTRWTAGASPSSRRPACGCCPSCWPCRRCSGCDRSRCSTSSPAAGRVLRRQQPGPRGDHPATAAAPLLPAANALSTASFNLGFTVGPLLGGVLIGWQGLAAAYLVDCATFTAALYALWRLPPVPPEGEVRRAGLQSVLEGLRYLRTRPNVLMTFLVDLCAMVLAQPRALFPAVAGGFYGGGTRDGRSAGRGARDRLARRRAVLGQPRPGAAAGPRDPGLRGRLRRGGRGVRPHPHALWLGVAHAGPLRRGRHGQLGLPQHDPAGRRPRTRCAGASRASSSWSSPAGPARRLHGRHGRGASAPRPSRWSPAAAPAWWPSGCSRRATADSRDTTRPTRAPERPWLVGRGAARLISLGRVTATAERALVDDVRARLRAAGVVVGVRRLAVRRASWPGRGANRVSIRVPCLANRPPGSRSVAAETCSSPSRPGRDQDTCSASPFAQVVRRTRKHLVLTWMLDGCARGSSGSGGATPRSRIGLQGRHRQPGRRVIARR